MTLNDLQPMTGSLSILNTGTGDIKVTFNQHNKDERTKAIAMLKDMQMRGYAILVRLPDDTYVRAKSIDEETGSYVINLPDDYPPIPGELLPDANMGESLLTPEQIDDIKNTPIMGGPAIPTDGLVAAEADPVISAYPAIIPPDGAASSVPASSQERPKTKSGRPRKLPVDRAHATGVARSAGG